MNLKLKLGCDPELFLMDRERTLRSAVGLIGGSKQYPLPLEELGDGYAVQEDNVAMEFNIPPASSAQEFATSVKKTIDHLLASVDKAYGFSISPLSAAEFSPQELATPEALEFGCDPDFNAWTGGQNPRPKAKNKALRSCGGHIHVGVQGVDPTAIIKAMDLFLGVPSVLMDSGELRKQLYGKAGAYRKKTYGVEYRTLSNFWVFSPNLCDWAWKNTERAVNAVVAQFPIEEDKDLILNAINSNNKDMARFLVNKHGLEVINV